MGRIRRVAAGGPEGRRALGRIAPPAAPPPAAGRTAAPASGREPPKGPTPRGPDLAQLRRELSGGAARVLGGQTPARSALGLLAGMAAIALAFWMVSGVYQVQGGQAAAVFRLGRLARIEGPGLRWHWPAPFERVDLIPRAPKNILTLGFVATADVPEEGLMLTGDGELAQVNARLTWGVSDPRAYVSALADPAGTLKAVAEAALRRAVGRVRREALMQPGPARDAVAVEARAAVQAWAAAQGSGIAVADFAIGEVKPPAEVAPAFRAIDQARNDAAANVQAAEEARTSAIDQARAQAAKTLAAAQKDADARIKDATAAADRIEALEASYRRAPEAVREKLYLETMQRVLSRSRVVIVDAPKRSAPLVLPPSAFTPGGPTVVKAAPPASDRGVKP